MVEKGKMFKVDTDEFFKYSEEQFALLDKYCVTIGEKILTMKYFISTYERSMEKAVDIEQKLRKLVDDYI